MRAQHTAHPFLAFPVYSCAFIANDQILVGGGGGASRTGIKNKLRLFRVSDDRQLHVLGELELGKGEDAPMSMVAQLESKTFVCGINSSTEKLEKGENENCRKFSLISEEHKFTQLATRRTLTSGSPDDYQRVTVLAPNGKHLVVAGTHDFSLLDYNSLSPLIPSVHVSSGEIYDATFSSSHLFLATSSKLLVYAIPVCANIDGVTGDAFSPTGFNLIKTLDAPPIAGVPSGSSMMFRAARLHPTRQDTLYSVINITLPRVKHAKLAKKQAYILKWMISITDDAIDARLETTRKISDGNLTCFDVSSDGRLLAFGASDYSLGVLDSNTLTPLLTILKAHEFPITTLRFNPTSNLLVSGGVDSSIRVVSIPEVLGGQSWSAFVLIIIAVAIIIVAVLMQR